MSPLDHLREADHQLDALVSAALGSRERDTVYQLVLRDLLLATIELAEQVARLSAQVETVEPTLAMGPSSEPAPTDTGDLAEASVHEVD